MEESCFLCPLAPWLHCWLAWAQAHQVSYTAQLENGTTHSGLGLSVSTKNQDNLSGKRPRTDLLKTILNWNSILLGSSRLCWAWQYQQGQCSINNLTDKSFNNAIYSPKCYIKLMVWLSSQSVVLEKSIFPLSIYNSSIQKTLTILSLK